MAWVTYSFDKGNGKRRRGITQNPERRKQEHKRESPRMRDWRQWEHKNEKAARDHEKHLHTLDD